MEYFRVRSGLSSDPASPLVGSAFSRKCIDRKPTPKYPAASEKIRLVHYPTTFHSSWKRISFLLPVVLGIASLLSRLLPFIFRIFSWTFFNLHVFFGNAVLLNCALLVQYSRPLHWRYFTDRVPTSRRSFQRSEIRWLVTALELRSYCFCKLKNENAM